MPAFYGRIERITQYQYKHNDYNNVPNNSTHTTPSKPKTFTDINTGGYTDNATKTIKLSITQRISLFQLLYRS